VNDDERVARLNTTTKTGRRDRIGLKSYICAGKLGSYELSVGESDSGRFFAVF
jgi:hypothetical protein